LPPQALELTEVEQRLLDAARRGQPFALGKAGPAELAGTEDPGRCVRGAVLRDLLLGRQGELDPHGVRLAHARVTAPLNLDDVTSAVPLMLVNCALPRSPAHGRTCAACACPAAT
jgi:hypothetical protein